MVYLSQRKRASPWCMFVDDKLSSKLLCMKVRSPTKRVGLSHHVVAADTAACA